jgi:hypothetical protein
MENIERKCWKCKTEKPLTNEFFSKDSIDKLGYQKACKVCQKARAKVYNEANKDYFKQKNKENYKKEDNKERYQKYKPAFLERRNKQGQSIRGRLYTLLNAAQGRAKKNNLHIDIDLNFLLNLYEQQQGKCKLTNIEFTFINRSSGNNFNPFNPSIDKIDATKGYTKDNVRLVCTIVNLALNTFGEGDFKIMCEAYINNSKNNNID